MDGKGRLTFARWIIENFAIKRDDLSPLWNLFFRVVLSRDYSRTSSIRRKTWADPGQSPSGEVGAGATVKL
jgi:hypothetical protein